MQKSMEELAEGVITDPLWQQVAGLVRRSIQAGKLRPGDRVIEAQLARQLGISRNPIREGLRKLIQQGILEYRPNIGTVVAHLSEADAQLATKVRTFLEMEAVSLILNSNNGEWQDQLGKILAEIANVQGNGNAEELESLDEKFHSAVVAASGSTMLKRVWEAIDPYTWMAIAWEESHGDVSADHEGFYESHRRFLDILIAGDVAKAKEAIKDHIWLAFRVPGTGLSSKETAPADATLNARKKGKK